MKNTSVLWKTIVYRINVFCIMWFIIWITTGDIQEATWFTLIFESIRFVLYFLFEKIWNYWHRLRDNECIMCGGKGACIDFKEGSYDIYFCHKCKRAWGIIRK